MVSISTSKYNTGRVTKHNLIMACSITENNNKLTLSIEDTAFLKIMDFKKVYRDDENSWVAPMPFKIPQRHLLNNCKQVFTCLSSLCSTLDKKPVMKQQSLTFMGKIFEDDHAEPTPLLKEAKEYWYLLIFGVYHPQKVIFDSSAPQGGASLKDVLLTGSQLNNSLLAVLIHF